MLKARPSRQNRDKARRSALHPDERIVAIALLVIGVVLTWQLLWDRSRPDAATMATHHFRTCKEARVAGAAPLRRGEPWYRPWLDEDHDGVACEFHPRALLDDLLG